MKKKYLVTILEVYESYREVEAENPEEAKWAALDDAATEVDLVYKRTLSEFKDISVDEVEES